MLTQKELDMMYVDSPAAAKILGVTSNQVRFLCSKGRLQGAMKLGTSGWIIPRESVLNYRPLKKGRKPGVSNNKTTSDKKIIEDALKEYNKWKTRNNNNE
ncbi:MAG: hypothetical protein IJQ99_00475 [Synergistaceae bacterium]|nr:hypothetical protein [Synergistaceae bacterium]